MPLSPPASPIPAADRLLGAIARLGEGVLLVDADGSYRYQNARAAALLAAGGTRSPSELRASVARAAADAMATGGPVCTTMRGGPVTVVECRAYPADDGALVLLAEPPAGPERPLASIVHSLPDVVFRHDRAGRVLFVNEAIRHALGLPPEHFIGRLGPEVNPTAKVAEQFAAARDAVFAGGEPVTFEVRRTRADGDRCVEYRVVPERGPDGAVDTVLSIGRDVTDREEARAGLEAERARLTEAQRIARLGSWTWNLVTGESHGSDEIVHLLGDPEAAVDPAAVLFRLLAPEERERSAAKLRDIDAGRLPESEGQWRIVRPDGETRVVHTRSFWRYDDAGRRVEGTGTIQDVTQQVEDASRLTRQQALLEESQRIAGVGSWELELATGTITWSDEMYRIAGLAPDTGVPMTRDWLRTLVHADDMPAVQESVARSIATGDPDEHEWRLLRADGAQRIILARTRTALDAGGRAVRVVGSCQDITDRRAAEAALRLSQEQQVALLQSIPDAAWLKDIDGRYVAVNAALLRSRESTRDMLGRTAADIFEPHFAREYAARDAEVLAAGRSLLSEDEDIGPDGEPRWFETVRAPYRDAEGRVAGTVGIARETTGRRRLEEQVRQAQKMEALGMLAGGVAHDFNNLLSAIIGGTELARLEVADGTRLAEDLDDVRQAGARAAQLTGQLLAFSRKELRRPRVLDLRDAVRGAETLLRRLVPDDVALDVIAAAAPCVVRADAGQLEQVLINLVVNARDAVVAAGAGPRLVTVSTAQWDLAADDPRLARGRSTPLAAGPYAALVVRDTGVGMSTTTLAHVFEPFFTTKPLGEGTGLGLATVFGIAGQSGGAVLVDSAPGAGATFTVLLPAVDAPLDALELGAGVLPRGTETILLVEDERIVRETAARILERHGYRVLAARHGADALLAWTEHGASIDAAITDLRMPEMDGQTLLAHLRADRPSLPIVVMSGYAIEQDTDDSALPAHEVFLAKPFTTETLLVQLRAALDRRCV